MRKPVKKNGVRRLRVFPPNFRIVRRSKQHENAHGLHKSSNGGVRVARYLIYVRNLHARVVRVYLELIWAAASRRFQLTRDTPREPGRKIPSSSGLIERNDNKWSTDFSPTHPPTLFPIARRKQLLDGQITPPPAHTRRQSALRPIIPKRAINSGQTVLFTESRRPSSPIRWNRKT